ncbi:MAG: c-type cytochrome [Deltaproteobacteria bacterium]|nr:c-type cytochrome [Deltaproteobacteria bacterium]MCW5807900.1 c-type cytochrome [Deltaproteobacteria bacterium]
MSEDSDAPVLDHAYDGIQEYDNPLPGWWRMLFLGTIVFAGFYGLYFHVVGWGRTPGDHYRDALATYDEKRELRDRAELASVTEAELAQRARSREIVEHGHAVFRTRCVACHKEDGSGHIGPNLTDNFQIHGSTRLDIFKTVRGGAPGTSMIAWSEQLPASDVFAVAIYASTLRGKNLPGKAREGQPVGPLEP